MKIMRAGLILSCVAFLALGGCDSRPKRVPVTGKVLIDGQPLKYGTVIFMPKNGRQSTGPLDENGNFTLTCYDPNDGALVGTHDVTILAGEAINNTTTKFYAPQKYADRKTSGLTQEIKPSNEPVVINLTWKGSPPEKEYVERAQADPGEESFGRAKGKKG